MTLGAGAADKVPRRLAAALALLLFFSVLSLWVRERWALGLFQAGIFLLGILWAAGWGAGRLPVRTSFLFLPLTAAAAWGLLQLAVQSTVYRLDTWNSVLSWLSAIVLVFLSMQALDKDQTRHRLLRALLYFGFAVSVLATTQYFTSHGKVFWLFPSGYPDALGPFVYKNNYAAFVELLLPMAVVEALRDRRNAAMLAVMAGVMYASVVASASRAGSILTTAEVFAVLVLAGRRGLVSVRGAGLALLRFAVLAAIFVAVVGVTGLFERFKQEDPYVHRREMLQSSLAMARERPWMGFGLGTYEKAYPAYALFDIGLVVNHAHNDWAEWLVEGGAPFLAFLLSVAAWAVAPAVRSIWGIGVLSVFLHALVDYPMQRLGLAAWVFVLLGALAAENARGREAVSP